MLSQPVQGVQLRTGQRRATCKEIAGALPAIRQNQPDNKFARRSNNSMKFWIEFKSYYEAKFEISAFSCNRSNEPWASTNGCHPACQCTRIPAFLGSQALWRMAGSKCCPHLSRPYRFRLWMRGRERHDNAGGAGGESCRLGSVSKHVGVNQGSLFIVWSVRLRRALGIPG